MRLYVCTDHDAYYSVGVATVVIAPDDDEARRLVDAALQERGLKPYAEHPYTLTEVPMQPQALVLRDGNY